MEIKAEAKYLRISPRKLRLIAELVKKIPLERALAELAFMNKKGAGMILKLLKSALANATNNFNLKEEDLRIKSLTANKAIVFKRFQPVSRGMAHGYRRQTSHLKVVLEERSKNGTKSKS